MPETELGTSRDRLIAPQGLHPGKPQKVLTKLRKDPVLAIASIVLGVYLLAALAAPILAPLDPDVQNLRDVLKPPSSNHLLGTDSYGRDVFSRLLFGIRTSVGISVTVSLLAGIGGIILAIIAGYLGGVFDMVVSRIIDIGLAFPVLILALALISALGAGVRSTIIALVVGFIPFFARIFRSSVLGIRQEGYVESAKVSCVPIWRIVVRHVLRNMTGVVMVQLTLVFGYAILDEAGLSFIGLGVQTPTPSLGNMIVEGQSHLDAAWLMIVPGAATAVLITAALFVGDALRDASDPLITP